MNTARFCFFVALAAGALGANPLKLASQARLDLEGEAAVGALSNGFVTTGTGWLRRKTWLPADIQPRTYSVQWDIHRYGWKWVGFEFIPLGSGSVELRLMGPWMESSPGTIYRQEVFWDHGRALGAVLPNQSFEAHSANTVAGWWHPGGEQVVTNGPPAPAQGHAYVKVWHNHSLNTTINVVSGVPVRLEFMVRAVTPSNYVEMARIETTNTAAHQAAFRFMRGVNLGNYLEAAPGAGWGVPYTAYELDQIRSQGFDHVRIPVGWHFYTGPGPEFTLSSDIFAKVDFLVDRALSNGLAAIVNVHHFDDFTSNPTAHSNRLARIWQQVSAHYAAYPPELAFEFLNEPKDAAGTVTMSLHYAMLIPIVRTTNPGRVLFVGPGEWNAIDELGNLWLPAWDRNLIVTVHSYQPFYFTHQGAGWTSPQTATTNLVYPGPPPVPVEPLPEAAAYSWVRDWFEQYNTLPTAYNPCSSNAFAASLRFAAAWSEYYGRPVHVGEFGCYTRAPHASRLRFYREMRATLDACDLGWAMWDWHAGFQYWDADSTRPVDGMPDAMFPAPELSWNKHGQCTISAAKGKCVVCESAAPDDTRTWSAVVTQTLPRHVSALSVTSMTRATSAFYRVRWLK